MYKSERKPMGLAASQARFLAITARKADCEFQSMKIAQQKLSVTRQLSEISQEYQNAINSTKLVWNYDEENSYNLSYGILMNPTIMNGFNPYLITTRTGSVVLNSQMASAAEAVAPGGAPTARSAAGFNAFMNALVASGFVPASTAKSITDMTDLHYVDKLGNDVGVNLSDTAIRQNGYKLDRTYGGDKAYFYNRYDKNAGYGSEPMSKDELTSNNLVGLAARMKNVTMEAIFGDQISKNSDGKLSYKGLSITISKNNQELSFEDIKKLSIRDILNNDVVIVSSNDKKDSYDNSFVEDLLSALMGKVEYNDKNPEIPTLKSILGTDALATKSLENAYVNVLQAFTSADHAIKADNSDSKDTRAGNARGKAKEYMASAYSTGKGGTAVATNMKNLFGSLLTQMDLFMNGFNLDDYKVNEKVSSSNLVTDDPYYEYLMTGSNQTQNDDVIMKADFYMQLYNNICLNGWTENKDVEDDKYLEQMLKNGTYFITSVAQDGYFYQDRYNEHDCIVEVKDEDAIAQAELEFTVKKSKLTYQEDSLDIDMKNLDAEISSLTTEYDSVKNLISKNVEKVFTMFQ